MIVITSPNDIFSEIHNTKQRQAVVIRQPSGGEHVEVFAQEVGVITEDFKRVTAGTNMKRTRTSWWAEKGYAARLELFLKGVRPGEPPQVTPRDGARATVACLRMLESAKPLSPCTIDLESVLR